MILVPQSKIDDYVGQGWWGEQTLADLFIDTAERQPDCFAVADPPNRRQLTGADAKRWTWGDLLAQVGRCAALFHAQGLRKDDIVVLQLPNCVEMHALYLACAVSGIIVSPVPMQYRAHELTHVLASTGARLAITTARVGNYRAAAQWAAHDSQFESLAQIWAYGDGDATDALPAGVLALEPALCKTAAWSAAEMRAHMRAIDLSAHDVFTICWTSGTEARPKGVPRNHNEWLIVGRTWSRPAVCSLARSS